MNCTSGKSETDRIKAICRPYIDGVKEIREIKAEYKAPFVRE